jgi:hypothetical protein
MSVWWCGGVCMVVYGGVWWCVIDNVRVEWCVRTSTGVCPGSALIPVVRGVPDNVRGARVIHEPLCLVRRRRLAVPAADDFCYVFHDLVSVLV